MVRKEVISDDVIVYCGDCREVLPILNNAIDAVVTDPPYGIDAARNRRSQKHGWRDYSQPGWDRERPPTDLIRLVLNSARHTILWGGNYFTDVLPPPSKNKWLSWDKGQSDFSLADFELAWCSFPGAARRIIFSRSKAIQDGKEHATQKPVEVMRWCISKLPNGCVSVLDPFMGSGTTGVAAVNLGLKFIGVEIEQSFFEVACRRLEAALSSPGLFAQKIELLSIQEVMDL